MRGITSGCMSVGQLAFPSSECQLAVELIKYSSFPPFPLLPLAFAVCFYDLSVLLWAQRDNVEPPGIPAPLNLLPAAGSWLPLTFPYSQLEFPYALCQTFLEDSFKSPQTLFLNCLGFFKLKKKPNMMRHLYLIPC